MPPTRQRLLRRAPTLVGAGRRLSRPVQPIVLGVIADAALALDHRYFGRLQRRLNCSPVADGDHTDGRLAARWRHLVPLNSAMTQFLWIVSHHSVHREEREQHMIDLLDACLTAVQSRPTSPAPDVSACCT